MGLGYGIRAGDTQRGAGFRGGFGVGEGGFETRPYMVRGYDNGV